MRICGCEAHCSLQCRSIDTLPCPVQHFAITTFRFCSKGRNQLDSSSPMIVCRFHSLTATVTLVQPLSVHAASHADLWMQGSLLASEQRLKHSAMPSATFQNHKILVFNKRLQPVGLTCIGSHDGLSFPQLGCNSATGPAVVSATYN